MMKDITNAIDRDFDEKFDDIDVSSNDKFESVGTTLKSIYEAYEESRQ